MRCKLRNFFYTYNKGIPLVQWVCRDIYCLRHVCVFSFSIGVQRDHFYISCVKTSKKVFKTSCKFVLASISLEYHFTVIRKWLTITSVYGDINKKTVCFKRRQWSKLYKETGWDVIMFKQVRSRLSISQKEPLDVVFDPPSGFIDVNGVDMASQSDARKPE